MSTKGKFSIALFVGGAFLAGVLFATAGANLFGLGESVGTSSQAATLNGSTALSQTPDTTGPRNFEMAFADVAESVNPAVVQIRAEKVVERRLRNPFRGTPFEDFFGGPGGEEREFRSQGLGSGVFVQTDGHIVTNNHVIENADELSVVTHDGNQHDAEIVGTDPTRDLAVIKTEDAPDATAISFGNSDDLRTGQWVLAFGSPLSQELNNSVTAGIVSAMGRLQNPPQRQQQTQREQQISPVQNFIQTDAAINPGNSGGPLVNLDGELVGINTAIASQTGGYQGIGFAIPANTVERVATQLIETGEVRRGRLGVRYQPASQSLIENENLPRGAAIIGEVVEDSPAEEADLRPGDVVTAINGETLQNHLQLGNKVASMQPGDEVTLTINRDGETMDVQVTLGSASEEAEATADAEEETPSQDQMMEELGLAVRDISEDIARQLNLNTTDGVIITDVDRSNPAIRNSGLQPKLVIVEMAGKKITDVDTFQKVYAEIEPGQAFRVVVRSPQGFVDVTSLRKPQ